MAIGSTFLVLVGATLVSAGIVQERASCPNVHVFGARETTAPAGYGTAGQVVNSILSAFPGATSEAINYPACGGQASCGSVSYGNSVQQGLQAVANQVNAFNKQCPNTALVLVGYSQVSGPCIMEVILQSLIRTHRAAKSSMTRTAAAATPTKASATPRAPSRPPHKPRSRRPSSWATRATSPVSRTTSAPARQTA
jgi:hypothetical protein